MTRQTLKDLRIYIIVAGVLFFVIGSCVALNFYFPDHKATESPELHEYIKCQKIKSGTVIHYDPPSLPFYYRNGQKIILERCDIYDYK